MGLMSWAVGACLLIHGSLSITGDTVMRGCKIWNLKGKEACCEACHPGNRLYKRCGPDPKALCVPCEPEYYTHGPKEPSCYRCTQCIGGQFPDKPCTATTDTVCGCKVGFRCGNDACSFCVPECGKGEEPAAGRSCTECPNGKFNDQIHQKCKPWTTRCSNPGEYIVAMGNAVNDSKCGRRVMALRTVTPPWTRTTAKTPGPAPTGKDEPGDTEETWPVVVCVAVPSVALMVICIIMVVKIIQKRKTKWVPKTIIASPVGDYSDHVTSSDAPKTSLSPSDDSRTPLSPSDDPRSLIVNCDATESSYHEPEEEHGSSTESLASKDSKTQLIV